MKKVLFIILVMFSISILNATKTYNIGLGFGFVKNDYWDVHPIWNTDSDNSNAFCFIIQDPKPNENFRWMKSQIELSYLKKSELGHFQLSSVGKGYLLNGVPISFDGGGYAAYCTEDVDKKFDWGFLFGLGAEYQQFFVDFRFELGLRDLHDTYSIKRFNTMFRIGFKFSYTRKDHWE